MGHRLSRISAAVAVAASALFALTQAVTVLAASAALTITSGGCSGGGSAYCYNPEQENVKSGDTATWTNQSGVNHTVTSCTAAACPGAPANTGSQTFDVPVSAGGSGSVTFTQAGTYVYYCTIHGYAAMHGTVTVAAVATPTPTAAATATPTSTAAPSPTARPAGSATVSGTPQTGAGLWPSSWAALALIVLGSATWAVAAGRRRT